MSASIRFEPARESDFEPLLALRIATMRESLERLGRFHRDRARERFRSSFDAACMHLIFTDDAFVGCVTVRPLDANASEIEHFYIALEHQSRGLGGAIMKRLCDEADAAKKSLRLGVLRESDANRFYARHGFVETHRQEWDIYYERPPRLVVELTIEHAGARLRATADGRGASVIMLHAGVADRRMWRDTISHLASGYRAIAYDRRGFGETTTPDAPFSHIDDLRAIIAHSGGAPTILIGCSQGGRIAIDYALAYPGEVAALVLVATAISGAPSPAAYPASVANDMAELDAAEEKGDIDRVNEIEARLWLDGPLANARRVGGDVRQLFLAMNGIALRHPPLTHEQECEPAMSRLQSITAPSLIVWCDLDFPHIQERCERLAATMPNARGLRLTGCAHLPNLEQPAAFNAAIAAFLSALPSPR